MQFSVKGEQFFFITSPLKTNRLLSFHLLAGSREEIRAEKRETNLSKRFSSHSLKIKRSLPALIVIVMNHNTLGEREREKMWFETRIRSESERKNK